MFEAAYFDAVVNLDSGIDLQFYIVDFEKQVGKDGAGPIEPVVELLEGRGLPVFAARCVRRAVVVVASKR